MAEYIVIVVVDRDSIVVIECDVDEPQKLRRVRSKGQVRLTN